MNEFQQVIKAYLDQRAQEDAQFAANYAKKGKSDTRDYVTMNTDLVIETGGGEA